MIRFHREITANYAKHTVNVDAALCQQQQRAVQWCPSKRFAELQVTHFPKRAAHSRRRHNVQQYFAHSYL